MCVSGRGEGIKTLLRVLWHFVALVIVCARLKQRRRGQVNQFKHGTFGSCFLMDFFLLLIGTAEQRGRVFQKTQGGDEEEGKEKVGSTHDASTGPVLC